MNDGDRDQWLQERVQDLLCSNGKFRNLVATESLTFEEVRGMVWQCRSSTSEKLTREDEDDLVPEEMDPLMVIMKQQEAFTELAKRLEDHSILTARRMDRMETTHPAHSTETNTRTYTPRPQNNSTYNHNQAAPYSQPARNPKHHRRTQTSFGVSNVVNGGIWDTTARCLNVWTRRSSRAGVMNGQRIGNICVDSGRSSWPIQHRHRCPRPWSAMGCRV